MFGTTTTTLSRDCKECGNTTTIRSPRSEVVRRFGDADGPELNYCTTCGAEFEDYDNE